VHCRLLSSCTERACERTAGFWLVIRNKCETKGRNLVTSELDGGDGDLWLLVCRSHLGRGEHDPDLRHIVRHLRSDDSCCNPLCHAAFDLCANCRLAHTRSTGASSVHGIVREDAHSPRHVASSARLHQLTNTCYP